MDTIINSLLDELYDNPDDPSSLAALQDYLSDLEPVKIYPKELPNWLKLDWIQEKSIPTSILYEIRQYLNCDLKRFGKLIIKNRSCFASDSAEPIEKIQSQAEILRKILRVVAVAIPHGAPPITPTKLPQHRLLVFKSKPLLINKNRILVNWNEIIKS